MEREWLEMITNNLEEKEENLFLVSWNTGDGVETLTFTSSDGIEEYLASHNFDPSDLEIMEVKVTKRFTWKKVVELKEI